MKFLMPLLRKSEATSSTPNPLATAPKSSTMRGSAFCSWWLWMLTFCQPTNWRRLSTVAVSGHWSCLKPKPQALTRGATVTSKAPLVASLMERENWNTISSRESVCRLSPELMRLTVLCLLNMESEESTASRRSMMSACRLLPYWYLT